MASEMINKIICGDCLEAMKDIPDKSIDMILCDLPFNATECKWDILIPFEPLWEQYKRLIKDDGAIVLFGSQPFTSKLIMSNLKMFKYEWIWQKKTGAGFALARCRAIIIHENILIFSKANTSPGNKNNMKYFPQGLLPCNKISKHPKSTEKGLRVGRKHKIKHFLQEFTNYPKSILSFSHRLKKDIRYHPTQKPVALCEYMIKTYTNEGETVLDNCCGSGTTAIACINTNRNYICIEKDVGYCEIARKRIEGALSGK